MELMWHIWGGRRGSEEEEMEGDRQKERGNEDEGRMEEVSLS